MEISHLIDVYNDWGFMDPKDFYELAQQYAEQYGNEAYVLDEGTLIDTMLLFPGECPSEAERASAPVILAIPYATTTWSSTYKVHAWAYDETPEDVWEYLEASQEQWEDDEAYREAMYSFKEQLMEM